MRRLLRAAAGTSTTSRSGRLGGRQLAHAECDGQPGDRPALLLAVELGELGDRQRTGVDQVAEHPARTDRRELGRVADDDQVGPVGDGGQQRGAQLDVQHRGLVDDDQIGIDRIVGIPVETR